MEERVFRLIPLTPVHVGTGETIAPDEYFLDRDRLVRINVHKILMNWPPATRQRFEQLIAANRIDDARKLMHEAAGSPQFHLYRALVGEPARQELQNAPPDRRSGEIHTFVRNLHAGVVIVPGSAVKGAIRTAVVSVFAHHQLDELKRSIPKLFQNQQERNRAWMALEEKVLHYKRRFSEQDPLRMLRVSDGELPPEAVRVDRVRIVNRSGKSPQVQSIQLHVERLLSRADGKEPPSCLIRIALDGRARVSRSLTWDFVMQSCNYFFRRRYQEEVANFTLLQNRNWVPGPDSSDSILLRIGRFSHFESLSVDELRSGWNAQRKRPIQGMGASRSLCMITGGVLTPFGWVLLEPVEERRDGARAN